MNDEKLFIQGEELEESYEIQGLFSGLKKLSKKTVKAVTQKTGLSLLKDLKPILSTAKKLDPKLLTAINPALGGVKLGYDLLKDIKTTQKETGKEISFGIDNVMKWYQIGFAKGLEAQTNKIDTVATGTQANTNTIVESVKENLDRSRNRARKIVRG